MGLRKQLIALAIILPTLGLGVTAKADTLGNNYNKAYSDTMRVVDVANKYGVKPFFKQGDSPLVNVVNSVLKGHMQERINQARVDLKNLPSSIQISINTLSSILDNYEQPVYYKIFNTIEEVNEATATNYLGINSNSDFDTIVKNFAQNQGHITDARILIANIPTYYKNSYSSSLDKAQQTLLDTTNTIVNLALSTNYQTIKSSAQKMLDCLKGQPGLGDDVKTFVSTLDNKLNDPNWSSTSDYLGSNELTNQFNAKYQKINYKGPQVSMFNNMLSAFVDGQATEDELNQSSGYSNTKDPYNLNKCWKVDNTWYGIKSGDSSARKITVNYSNNMATLFSEANLSMYVPAVYQDDTNDLYINYKLVRTGDKVTIYLIGVKVEPLIGQPTYQQ